MGKVEIKWKCDENTMCHNVTSQMLINLSSFICQVEIYWSFTEWSVTHWDSSHCSAVLCTVSRSCVCISHITDDELEINCVRMRRTSLIMRYRDKPLWQHTHALIFTSLSTPSSLVLEIPQLKRHYNSRQKKNNTI